MRIFYEVQRKIISRRGAETAETEFFMNPAPCAPLRERKISLLRGRIPNLNRSLTILIVLLMAWNAAQAQDHCANAISLCVNSTVSSTTQSATVSAGDPALSCGDLTVDNNVWFTVTGIANGSCTITVGAINNNPGLAVEVYTGSCGSLVSTGTCNSANGPAGSMNVTFAVTSGTTYYIMVDGQSGNQEAFTIRATSVNSAIMGRPQPSFIPATLEGCIPLVDLLTNTTVLFGGSNITYQWRVDGGAYVPGSGSDTTVTFSTTGTHDVDLKVCNTECGCASATEFIDALTLVSTITPPSSICVGAPASFSGDATYQPSGDPANVANWYWDFGDPASAPNDTATGQFVSHTFVGAGPNFTVTLIVTSVDCGTDTVTTVVNANLRPTVTAGADQFICDLSNASLTATTTNTTAPVTYQWSGVGIFSCDTCQSTTVSSLPGGASYNISIHIQDANGCTADSSVNITVTSKPIVDLGNDTTVCKYSSVQLNANVTTGTPPFTYRWTPASGLSDTTIFNPVAFVSSSTMYCVLVRDTIGCPSDTTCINIDIYVPSLVIGSPKALCASDSPLNTTFTVTGAGAGSTYQWYLSPDYSLIDSSSADSSTIRATFPTGVAATYNFTCIVTDGVTGCIDTVSIAYQVVGGLTMTLTPSVEICQGDTATLVATGANTYAWTASPAYPFADSTLDTQVVNPSVTTTFSVLGSIGSCTQVLSDTVTVHSKPVVTVLNSATICPNTPTQIFANVTGGTGTAPFVYTWTPAAGLDNASLPNPTATINSTTQYCASVTDSANCKSDTACLILTVLPTLTVSASPATLCATDTNMNVVFTVNGAGAGSTYQWYLSPDYGLITASNIDSSSVTATLPQGVAATYHFTVVVIDGVTGCHDTIFQPFTVTSGLTLSISGPSTICTGQSATLTASGATTYSWTATPAYPFGNPNLAVQTISPAVSTTFTVTGATGLCTGTATYTVTVNAVPTAVAAPIPTFCGCDSVALDDSGSTGGLSYSWTSAGGNSIFSPSSLSTGSYICNSDSFTLIVTDLVTGCADTASTVANQKNKPDATATVSPTTICGGYPATVLLDGTGSDANTGTTYLWTSNNPNAVFADSSALVTTVTVDATTTFFLMVTDSAGCDSVFTIILNATPRVFVDPGPPQTICEGATATLNATSNGTLPIQWQWSGIFGFSCDTCPNTQVSGMPAGGPYTMDIFITDANGCTADSTVDITVVTGPTASLDPDMTVCRNSIIQLNGAASGTTPPFTPTWTPTSGLDDSTIFNPNATIIAPIQYCLVVTDGAGCTSNTACQNFDLYPPPAITPSPASHCFSDPDMTTRFTVTAGAGSTYSWYLSGDYGLIDSSSVDSSVVRATLPPVAGNYNFTVIVHDGVTGCVDTVSTTYAVISGVVITVTGPSTVCSGNSVTLTASGNAVTYAWTANPAYPFADSTLAVQTVSPAVMTVFTVLGTTGSCSATVTDTVFVNSRPAAVVSAITPFCGCATVALDGSSSTPGMKYTWTSVGGNSIINPNQITASSFLCATDNFQLLVTDTTNGCADSTVAVATELPLPAATFTETPNVICLGTPTSVVLDGTGSDTNGGTVYHWTSDNPNAVFTDTTALSPSATIDTVTVFHLTVTDINGCDSTYSDTVKLFPLPVITASPPLMCKTDPFRQTTITVNGTGAGSTYTWDSIPPCAAPATATDSIQLFDFSGCGPGTYSFYVTVNDGVTGCVNQVHTTVSVITTVTMTVSNDTVICEGASITLTAAGANSYSWSPTGDTTSSILVNGLTAAGSPYKFFVTGTVGSCSQTDSITVTVNTTPQDTISGNTAACQGDTMDVYTTSFTAGSTYFWTVTGGIIQGGQGTDTVYINWTTPGVDSLTVVETTAGGCITAPGLLVVTVDTLPIATVNPHAASVCGTDSFPVNGSVNISSGVIHWTTTGGGTFSDTTIASPTYYPSVTDVGNTVTLTMNVTTTCGTSADSVLLTVNALPSVTIAALPADSLCAGSTDTLVATGGGTYLWSTSETTDSIFITPVSTTTYYVTVTSGAGCITSDSISIRVNPLPQIDSISGPLTICGSDSVLYIGYPNANYSWAVTNGTLTSGQNTDSIYVSWDTTATSGIVVATMTNSSGCTDSITDNISINYQPVPLISGLNTVCEGDTIEMYIATFTAGATYNWVIAGGTIQSGQGTDTVYVNWTTPGSDTLAVAVTNSSGCSNGSFLIITVNPLPVVTLTALPADSMCAGNTDTLIATGGGTYLWSTTETTDSIFITPPGTATYFVTVTSAAGCNSVDSILITVNPLPQIDSISGPTSVCNSDSILYAGYPIGNYGWLATSGTILSGQNTDSVYVTWDTTATTGTLVATMTNLSGCSNSLTDNISINYQQVPLISGLTTVCEGDTMEMYMATYTAGSNYNWAVVGGVIQAGQGNDTVYVNWTTAGADTISVVATNAAGCSNTSSLAITVNPIPVVTVTALPDTVLCFGSTDTLIVTGGGTYLWSTSATTDSIFITPGTTATYFVTVTNGFSCTATDSIVITVNPAPQIDSIVGPSIICGSDSMLYIAYPNGSYSWSVTNGIISSGQNTDSVYIGWDTTATTGTIIITTTNSSGCSASLFQTDSIKYQTIPAISGLTSVCNGDTMELYQATYNSSATYNWSVFGGTIQAGQGTDSIYLNWTSAGMDTVAVVETNSSGCSSKVATWVVRVDTIPFDSVSPRNVVICGNDSLIINGTVNISGGNILWTTTGNGTFNDSSLVSPVYYPSILDTGTTITLTSKLTATCGIAMDSIHLTINPYPIVTVTALPNDTLCPGNIDTVIVSGTYSYLWSTTATTDTIYVAPTVDSTFIVTVTNAINCRSISGIELIVIPLATIDSISGLKAVCGTDSVLYIGFPMAGYNWTAINGNILSGQNTDSVWVQWDTLMTTGYITIKLSNTFGCIDSLQDTVSINSATLTSSITGPDSVCAFSTITYYAASHSGSVYNWVIVPATDTIVGSNTLDSVVVKFDSSGVATLQVQETSAGGCISPIVFKNITVFAQPPTPVITGDTACENDSAWYSVPADTNATFNWTVTGGTILSGQGRDSVLINWTTPGLQVVTVVATYTYGCVSSPGYDSLIVNPTPVISVLPDTLTICRNTTLSITGVTNYATVHWITSGSGTFNDTATASTVYTPGLTDSARVVLTATITSPCGIAMDSVVLMVNPSPVNTMSRRDTICFGSQIALVATGGGTYVWSNGVTIDSITVSPNVTTTYTVIVNNVYSCPDTDSVVVVVKPPGLANAGLDQFLCTRDSVYLNGSIAQAGALIWTTMGDGTFTDSTAGTTYYHPGNNDIASDSVYLILTPTGACINFPDTVKLTFSSKPTAYAGRDTILETGPNTGVTVPLNPTVTNTSSVHWTTSGTGTFTPDDTTLKGLYTPSDDDFRQDSIVIKLVVTGPCGTDSSYFIIEITPYKIPNIVTPYPNSPGYNDYFVIFGLPPGSKLKIWDRWGLLVYESDNYQNDWDAHGLSASEFYYVLQTRKKEYHGWIQVFR